MLKQLFGVEFCTYIILHSEAQTFNCWNEKKTHFGLKGDFSSIIRQKS